MNSPFEAIYENGVFRPVKPVPYKNRDRVLLTIEVLGNVEERVLDHEFLEYCETQADDSISLETVRQALAKISGSLSEDIRAERDER
jgi:predicted DNA-binding antitoxin AbrB/MazE fold protein